MRLTEKSKNCSQFKTKCASPIKPPQSLFIRELLDFLAGASYYIRAVKKLADGKNRSIYGEKCKK